MIFKRTSQMNEQKKTKIKQEFNKSKTKSYLSLFPRGREKAYIYIVIFLQTNFRAFEIVVFPSNNK